MPREKAPKPGRIVKALVMTGFAEGPVELLPPALFRPGSVHPAFTFTQLWARKEFCIAEFSRKGAKLGQLGLNQLGSLEAVTEVPSKGYAGQRNIRFTVPAGEGPERKFTVVVQVGSRLVGIYPGHLSA